MLKLDWVISGRNTQNKPLSGSATGWKRSENLLCRPPEAEKIVSQLASATSSGELRSRDSVPLKSIGLWQSIPLFESPFDAGGILNNKIFRSWQNVFGFSQNAQQNLDSESSSVMVVNPDRKIFQVLVNNHLVATLSDKLQAQLLRERLAELLKNPIDASQLRPALVNKTPALVLGDRLLFVIDSDPALHLKRSREVLAIEWSNNLRIALGTRPLTLVEAQLQMYGLVTTNSKISGLASWYGPYFHGRLTATGETFNQHELTAAHPSLPFNTYLHVTNKESGNSVIVRVNDRGPYITGRSLDLSLEAARCLESESAGVIAFEAVVMQPSLAQNYQVDKEVAKLSKF